MKEITIKDAIEVCQKANEILLEKIQEMKAIKDTEYVKEVSCEYYSVLVNCLNEYEACELAIKSMQKIEKITNLKEGFYYIHDGKIHPCTGDVNYDDSTDLLK